MRGFALLEALLASTILVVGVLSLAQLLTFASRANVAAGHMTAATILAAAKMEELRSLPWGETAGEDRIEAHRRRWSITPLASASAHAAVVEVQVDPGAVRLIALRARLAP